MISHKLFIVILVLHSIGQSDSADCKNSNNCKVEDSIANITCQQNSQEASECVCVGDSCGDLAEGLKYEGLNPNLCGETLCANAIPTCTFWKYQQEGGAQAHVNHCYLLNENQCSERDDSDCPDENHGTVTCESGIGADVDCEDTEPTPPTPGPPTTTPSPYVPCPGPIALGNDTTKYYQKWNCFELINGIPTTKDMYALEASMPVGGYCQLDDSDESCKTDANRYTCTGTDESKENVWVNAKGHTDDLLDGKLKEVGCKAKDYTIDPPQQEGRLISCAVEESEPGIIPAENGCIMLCDDLPAFSFYTDFAERGSRDWFYEIIGNPSSKEKLDDGMLDCWGKR